MKNRMKSRFVCLLAIGCIGGVSALMSPLHAGVIGYDTFDGADTPTRDDDASDATDLQWWQVENVTLSVTDDAGGLGSGNALSGVVSGSVNQIVAPFETCTLANVGDVLRVNFDFRLTASSPKGDRAPAFGFFNGAGTPITGDNQKSNGLDDFGYFARVDPGQETAGSLGRQTPEVRGDFAPLAGSDNNLGPAGTIDLGFDGTPHNFDFTLTRTEQGVALKLTVTRLSGEEGAEPIVVEGADVAADAFYSFDHFYLRSRSQTYRLDNVLIEFIPVPEPGTVGLLGLGGLALLGRRVGRKWQ